MLLLMIMTYGADGLMMLSMLSIQLIYKNEFKVEPSELQMYQTFMMIPIIFRIFIGVFIDSKLMKRKNIGLLMNIIPCFAAYSIAF